MLDQQPGTFQANPEVAIVPQYVRVLMVLGGAGLKPRAGFGEGVLARLFERALGDAEKNIGEM